MPKFRNNVDPAHCYMLRVQGEAIAPALPDGCLVLVNPDGKQREDDRLYLVRSSQGLIARRAKMGPNGTRVMVPGNPAFNDPVWPPDTDVMGELVWTVRGLGALPARPKWLRRASGGRSFSLPRTAPATCTGPRPKVPVAIHRQAWGPRHGYSDTIVYMQRPDEKCGLVSV